MKELREEALSRSVIHALAEQLPLLVAHQPTNYKVNKAENKVGECEDDEEDEIKLAE